MNNQDIPHLGFKVRLKSLGKFVHLVPNEKAKEYFLSKGIKERIIVIGDIVSISKFPPAVRKEILNVTVKITEAVKRGAIEDDARKGKIEFL
ncbi:MAG: hypothetical protein FD156_194 [Nitrospirae bacterium]|nr:MAG: hypothetical protein FD156_194 [Nitrospirota bacterium]